MNINNRVGKVLVEVGENTWVDPSVIQSICPSGEMHTVIGFSNGYSIRTGWTVKDVMVSIEGLYDKKETR